MGKKSRTHRSPPRCPFNIRRATFARNKQTLAARYNKYEERVTVAFVTNHDVRQEAKAQPAWMAGSTVTEQVGVAPRSLVGGVRCSATSASPLQPAALRAEREKAAERPLAEPVLATTAFSESTQSLLAAMEVRGL
jgi:hypothetical protein